jgi:signal transduction histidine kinase
MSRQKANIVVACTALVAVAVLALFAVQLNNTQSEARERVVSRFRDRAQVISALTQAIIASAAAPPEGANRLASRHLAERLVDETVAKSHLSYAVLLDRHGGVIAASRTMTPAERAQVLASPALRPVLAGARVSLSNVLTAGAGRAGVIDLAVSFQTDSGRRVLVSGAPTPLFASFLASYLRRVPTRGGTAYVLDSAGRVVGARGPGERIGEQVSERGLAQAVAGRSLGPYGLGGYFVAVPVSGSTWHVVLTSSRASLFSSVSGSRKWLPWLIFIALGIMALGFLAILRRLLASAAKLSSANAQLASGNARLESSNALLRHAAELSRSNAELEQFASIASHDLQEPLRKVQTFAAQLSATENDRLSEQGQDFLVRMCDAAGRMRSLIDDLLMFSRVSTQARPFATVHLDDIVGQVMPDLEVSIEESGAQVSIGDLPVLEADAVQMRQLLQNLLGNALKFRRADVRPMVRVTAVTDDHVAELTVEDNGIGFDSQYATRIFRAFERLNGAQAYQGTGIGLALCRKIVERHHGTITAQGEVGVGARFCVRLPIEQPTDQPSVTALFPETIEQEERSHALV